MVPTWALMLLYGNPFEAQFITIRVHGPLGLQGLGSTGLGFGALRVRRWAGLQGIEALEGFVV